MWYVIRQIYENNNALNFTFALYDKSILIFCIYNRSDSNELMVPSFILSQFKIWLD